MTRKKGTLAISVDMPEELHTAIHRYAKEKDLTVSQVIRQLIREFVKE